MADLFNATIKGEVVKVKKILSVYKTVINDVDQNGCTALLYSVVKNFEEICQLLIDAGADVDAVDTVTL
jgi:ankyrin repeat protein